VPAAWGPWRDVPSCLVPGGYVEGVRLAGGAPVVIPPDPHYVDDPEPVLDIADGLLLIGGGDIDPAFYGQEPGPETDLPNARRDAAELTLLRGALDRGLPVLGICRGFELLNVAYGGDLVQHLGGPEGALHRPELGTFGRHEVDVTGERLRGLLGTGVTVHSHHHQAIGRLGPGLVPLAYAPDGCLEALEDPARPFCLGVLWHPEEDWQGAGAPLFAALVEAAREHALARAA
jgi:putative glutamine amidotransferase